MTPRRLLRILTRPLDKLFEFTPVPHRPDEEGFVAAGIVLAALAGASAGYLSEQDDVTTQEFDFLPLSTFLPPDAGFNFLRGTADPSIPGDPERLEDFRAGLSALLETLANPDLDPSIRSSGLASIASGFSNARGAAGRTAATLGGVNALSPAALAASQASAGANFDASFGIANAEVRRENLALLGPILDFLNQANATRFGSPIGSTLTVEGNALLGLLTGGLQGASFGVGAAGGVPSAGSIAGGGTGPI